MPTTMINSAPRASRFNELEAILESQRADVVRKVQHKIRSARSDRNTDREVLDAAESSELDIQDDLGFALTQLKAEMLNQIEAALRRLEQGHYGNCLECGDEIAAARLRALPFAVRCRDCEQRREAADERERFMRQRRGSSDIFVDVSG